jgi:hypothetical protein
MEDLVRWRRTHLPPGPEPGGAETTLG